MKKLGLYVQQASHHAGNFTIDGDVRIDGTFTGRLLLDGTLYLGSLGSIDGEIHAISAHIDGTFSGALEAKIKTVFGPTAKFSGVLDTPILEMPPGAELIGTVRICKKNIS